MMEGVEVSQDWAAINAKLPQLSESTVKQLPPLKLPVHHQNQGFSSPRRVVNKQSPVGSYLKQQPQTSRTAHQSSVQQQQQQQASQHNRSVHQLSLHEGSTMSNREQLLRESVMISEFKRKNNPFEQGYARTDKIKYAGLHEHEASKRLFEFGTISSINQSHMSSNASQSTMKIKGIQNLRTSFSSNKFMQTIIDEENVILANPKLSQNIESLWKMNLLTDKKVQTTQLPRNQSITFVYNDYHCRSSNPGYARNDKSGTFFTR